MQYVGKEAFQVEFWKILLCVCAQESKETKKESGLIGWNGTLWMIDGRPEDEVKSEFLQRLRASRPLGTAKTGINGTSAMMRGTNGSSAMTASVGGGSVPAQAMMTCHYSLNR